MEDFKISENINGLKAKTSENADQIKINAADIETLQAECLCNENTYNIWFKNPTYTDSMLNVNSSGVYFELPSDKWCLTDYLELPEDMQGLSQTSCDLKIYDYSSGYRVFITEFDENYNPLGGSTQNTANVENGFSANGSKTFTIGCYEGTKYIRIQIYQTVKNCNQIMLCRHTDFVNNNYEYIAPSITVKNFYTKEETDKKISEVEINKDTVTECVNSYMSERYFDVYNSDDTAWYWKAITYEKLKVIYNTVNQYNMLSTTTVALKEDGDMCGHNSRMVVDEENGKIYVAHLVNTESSSGDSPSYTNNTFVRLNILSFTGKTITKDSSVILAQRGDAIDDTTINSGCGVPNLVLKDGVLYCIYEYYEDNSKNAVMGLSKYDISTGEITRNKCKFSYEGTTYDFNSSNLSLYVAGTDSPAGLGMNADITYNSDNGYYYGCACQWRSEVLKKGVIVRTTDFVNWEYVCVPPITLTCNAEFEGALAYFSGNYYFALRQNRPTTVGILAKFDSEWNLVEECYIPNCGSRSTFYISRNEKNLYLLNNPIDRPNADIVQISTTSLTNSKVRSQIGNLCNYMSAYWLRNSADGWLTFVCGTASPLQGVKIGAIQTDRYSADDALKKFKSVLIG